MSVNEEIFYGSGAARGSIVGDPGDLPRFVTELQPTLKATAGGTAYGTGSSFFWNAIDTAGAVAAVSVANTWTTIVDLTAAGLLGNVFASHGFFTGSKTVGIRITVDGNVWQWMETFVTTGLYGSLMVGALSGVGDAVGGFFPAANRAIETADAAPAYAVGVLPTSMLLSVGAPVLSFRQSLKVEVRNNRIGSGNSGQQAGCTYVLR